MNAGLNLGRIHNGMGLLRTNIATILLENPMRAPESSKLPFIIVSFPITAEEE
jgi:hypothetical protein